MKLSYRGHELEAHREESMTGDELLYWSIFRESDWYECDSGFTSGSDAIPDFIGYMKRRVDSELESETPWE